MAVLFTMKNVFEKVWSGLVCFALEAMQKNQLPPSAAKKPFVQDNGL
jgi:hypothetical protein